MGVILQGILGGFSGKVGPVVGGKWKDIDYMRGYVVPENPNTPAQQTVRTKFAKMVQFARSVLATILQPYWDPFYTNKSGFNAFISENYSTLDGSNDLIATSVMSKGTLENLHSNTATYDTANGQVGVVYSDAINGNGLTDDIVELVIYNKDTEIFYFGDTPTARADTIISFNIPTGLTPTNIIAWVFCHRGTGVNLVVSDSIGDVCAAA